MRRRIVLWVGVAALFLFATVIVQSLSGPKRCSECGGPQTVISHRDDQYMTATTWQCQKCQRFSVEHVLKDTGDGRYFDAQ
jgi:hypothetical protein